MFTIACRCVVLASLALAILTSAARADESERSTQRGIKNWIRIQVAKRFGSGKGPSYGLKLDRNWRKAPLEKGLVVLLQEWAASINDLGVDVKGLWLADFDSGDGYYYCWQLGEADIEYFHRYETGFAGRRPIERLA